MSPRLEKRSDHCAGYFEAMASPCEILVDATDETLARRIVETAEKEARRIEGKFSRYRDDSVVHRVNNAAGVPIEVDEEFAALLDFADRCYDLSAGRFDITSGVLRKLWRFDGGSTVPTRKAIEALLPFVGWEKVRWQRPRLTLPDGMEIDLGGIGKEYAVDRAVSLVAAMTDASVLVSFGGDLAVTGPRGAGGAWQVGVERADAEDHAAHVIDIRHGALATSGDARRFVVHEGRRYAHILDPRTGWPVADAPRSVTVLAGTCTEAGFLATLAMLHGSGAEVFLEEQGVKFWCERGRPGL